MQRRASFDPVRRKIKMITLTKTVDSANVNLDIPTLARCNLKVITSIIIVIVDALSTQNSWRRNSEVGSV